MKELDFLRAVAVIMVLGRHMRPAPPETVAAIRVVSDYWAQGGWMGVDLFFVLSGFLVSGLLFREQQRFGHIELGRFLVRRGLKIYPAFYLLLAISAVVFLVPAFKPLRWSDDIGWSNVLVEGVFLQNYLHGIWNHTWSLAVEEHFYLLLGLVFWWRTRADPANPFKGIGIATLIISVIILLLRFQSYSVRGPNFCFTHLRLDSLLFGVWLSYAYTYHFEAFQRFVQGRANLIAAASVALLLPITFFKMEASAFVNTVGYTCVYLGFGGFLSLVICDPRVKRLMRIPSAWLAPLGVYSYSIYLFHMPVRRASLLVLDRFVPGLPYLVRFGAYVALSFVVGIAVSRLLEIPMLHVRDRLFPSRLALPTAQLATS